MKNPASFEAVSKPQGEEEKLDIQGFSQELERRIGELDRHQQIRAKKWLAKLRICPLPKGQKLRDGYALLLLDAVTTKELRAPFNDVPLDGPLRPLEVSMKGALRDAETRVARTWNKYYRPWNGSAWMRRSKSAGADSRSRASTEVGAKEGCHCPCSTTALLTQIARLQQVVREQATHSEVVERQLELTQLGHEREVTRLLKLHQAEMKQLLAILLATQNSYKRLEASTCGGSSPPSSSASHLTRPLSVSPHRPPARQLHSPSEISLPASTRAYAASLDAFNMGLRDVDRQLQAADAIAQRLGDAWPGVGQVERGLEKGSGGRFATAGGEVLGEEGTQSVTAGAKV